MRKLIASLSITVALSACQKEEVSSSDLNTNPTTNNMTPTTGTFNPTGQTLLLQGNFENSGSYRTSGVAKIYEDKDKKRTLVLEDFKTNAGPDLRIYIAEDRSVTNFIQLTDKVQNGNLVLAIPANADLKKQNHVLIWCKQFAVLFGFAPLK
ncbi:MAG: DM13 domain-containing protein [Spirosomaceae bacterium]|jgi:hypothetical protein|nr:DM13 domain-containing protein [Spirosomataceae bacterium]